MIRVMMRGATMKMKRVVDKATRSVNLYDFMCLYDINKRSFCVEPDS